jgi:D-alanyl-D-alanine dipeptidase
LRSHTDDIAVGAVVLQNRHLLRDLMEAAGFINYEQEWWHYTLADEPFPEQYFDFPIQ